MPASFRQRSGGCCCPAARRKGLPTSGPLVCTCFGIGLKAIRHAITSRAAANVEEIGRALKAGTNCGSCLPELKRIVSEGAAAPA